MRAYEVAPTLRVRRTKVLVHSGTSRTARSTDRNDRHALRLLVSQRCRLRKKGPIAFVGDPTHRIDARAAPEQSQLTNQERHQPLVVTVGHAKFQMGCRPPFADRHQ